MTQVSRLIRNAANVFRSAMIVCVFKHVCVFCISMSCMCDLVISIRPRVCGRAHTRCASYSLAFLQKCTKSELCFWRVYPLCIVQTWNMPSLFLVYAAPCDRAASVYSVGLLLPRARSLAHPHDAERVPRRSVHIVRLVGLSMYALRAAAWFCLLTHSVTLRLVTYYLFTCVTMLVARAQTRVYAPLLAYLVLAWSQLCCLVVIS
jgi:hypothetical protein